MIPEWLISTMLDSFSSLFGVEEENFFDSLEIII
jgi:hypothetical protein